MSRELDEKIVSMEFDNRQFERNVKTSMGTLDKLKQKLNFKDAGKGLDDLNTSIRKVDFAPMTDAVETVSLKFNALKIAGTAAISHLVDQAMNAGQRLAKSLSIGQITSGFSKYENKIANMQTIMNSTGKSIEEIEGYMKELVWYSDETSYGLNDMFTALSNGISAGRNIEELIPMIEGVANATAFAGKNAAEFSNVMTFAMNQALQLGYLGTQDWKTMKSISTPAYQQAYIDAAERLGKIQKGQYTRADWSTLLTKKIFDTDVIIEANTKFAEFTRAVYKYREEQIALGKYISTSDAMELLAKDFDAVSVASLQSAQTCKTFTDAIEAIKDAVSTQWADSFEIMFGNLREAKKLWTEFNNVLYDIFVDRSYLKKTVDENGKELAESTMSLNDILAGVFRADYGNGFTGQQLMWDGILKILQSISTALYELRTAWNSVFPTEKTIEILQKFVVGFARITNALPRATNQFSRFRKVAAAVFDIVDILATIIKNSLKTAVISISLIFQKMGINIGNLVDESTGAVRSFKDWIKAAGYLEYPMYFIVGLVDMLLTKINELKDSLGGWHGILEDIKNAWNIVSTSVSTFFSSLANGEHTLDFSSVTGFFSSIVPAITGATAAVSGWFGKLGENQKIDTSKWSNTFTKILHSIPGVNALLDKFAEKTETIDTSKSGSSSNAGAYDSAKETGGYIVEGLKDGITEKSKSIWDAIVELAQTLINKFREVLGIHSPSKVFFALGGFIVAGLIAGIFALFPEALNKIKEFGQGIADGFGSIDFKASGNKVVESFKGMSDALLDEMKNFNSNTFLAVGGAIGIYDVAKVQSQAFLNISKPIGAIGDSIKKAGGALDSLKKNLDARTKALTTGNIAKIIKSIALVMVSIAGSMYIISQIPTDTFNRAAITMGVIVGVMGGIIAALIILQTKADKFTSGATSTGLIKLSKTFSNAMAIFVPLSISIIAVTAALAIIANSIQNGGDVLAAAAAVGVLMLALAGLTAAVEQYSKINNVKDMFPIIAGMLGLALATAAMARTLGYVAELAQKYNDEKGTIWIAIAAIGALGIFAAVLTAIPKATKSGGSGLKLTGFMGGLALLVLSVAYLFDTIMDAWKTVPDPQMIYDTMLMIGAMVGMVLICNTLMESVGKFHASGFSSADTIIAQMALVVVSIGGAYRLILDAANQSDPGTMKTVTAIMLITLGALSALVLGIYKLSGKLKTSPEVLKNMSMLSLMFMGLSGCLLVIGVAMKVMATVGEAELWETLGVIAALSAVASGMMILTRFMGSNQPKVFAALLGMGVLMALLSACLVVVSKSIHSEEDVKNLWTAFGLIGLLTLVAGAMMYLGDSVVSNEKAIAGMTAMVISLGVLAFVLSFRDWKQLIAPTLALSVLLGSLAVAFKIMHAVKVDGKSMTAMIFALTAIATALGVLSIFDWDSLLAAAGAMSLVLGAFTASLMLMSDKHLDTTSILGLVAVVLGLSGALGLLAAIPWQGLLAAAGALAIIMGALVGLGACARFFKDDAAAKNMIKMAAAVDLLALALLGIAGALAILSTLKDDLPALGENLATAAVNILHTLLTSIATSSTDITNAIGTMLVNGLTGIAEYLPDIIAAMNDIGLEIIQGIVDLLPDLFSKLIEGGKTIMDYAPDILSTVLDLLLMVINGLTDNMDKILDAVVPFVCKLLDGLAGKVGDLLGSAINFLCSLFDGISENVGPLISSVFGVIGAIVGGLAEVVAPLTEASLGPVADMITGFFVALANAIGIDGDDIVRIVDSVGNAMVGIVEKLGPHMPAIIEAIGTAGEKLNTSLAPILKDFGPVLTEIVKIVNGGVVSSLKILAPYLPKIADTIQGVNAAIIAVANSISNIAHAIETIAKTIVQSIYAIGFVIQILGSIIIAVMQETDKTIGTIFDGIIGIMEEVKTTLDTVLTDIDGIIGTAFDGIDKTLETSLTGIKEIVETFFDGSKDVVEETFKGIAGVISAPFDGVEGILEKALSGIKGIIDSIGTSFFSTGAGVEKLAKGIKTISELKFSQVTEAVATIADALISWSGYDDSISKVGDGMKNVSDSMTSVSKNIATMTTDVSGMIDLFLNMSTESVNVANLFSLALDSMTKKCEQSSEVFYNDGKTVITDFANGVTAAKTFFNTAVDGILNAFHTKVTNSGEKFYNIGKAVGDKMVDGITDAIAMIQSIIENDPNMQPVIRPVMDLTDLQNGVNEMNTLLNGSSLSGSYGMAGAANYSMSTRGNDNLELLKAVNELSDKVGAGGTSYTINGITYSDGTSVADAVTQLVRAAVISNRSGHTGNGGYF